MRRCTGECCRSFVLRHEVIDGEGEPPREEWFWSVEHLAQSNAELADLVFVREVVPETPEAQAFARFGCKAWDEATGACTIYERRPDACREYPASQPCSYCGAANHDEAVMDVHDGARAVA